MRARVLLRLAGRSLFLHKLRSSLSVLGVVFGVAAVVAMSSVGEGARREALAQIGALGIDTVTLRGAVPGVPSGLRLEDADSVRHVVPGVAAVAPVRLAALEAEAGGRRAEATAIGTTPAYREAARLELRAGRFLADLDLSDRKRVAVIGAALAGALFPLEAALGGRLRLGGDFYQVVGVLEERAAPRARGAAIRTHDVNRAVIVPLPSLDRGQDPRPDGIDEVVLRAASPERVVPAAEVARRVLLRASGADGLDVLIPREILRQRERAQRVFDVVMGAVAAISLLVGGIGIMNIMLASVAERTREVGIRRALGARRRDIGAQFLAESALLTAVGGAIGSLLGLLGAALIQRYAGWPTATHALTLAAALLVALVVGIGFGFYPAWHASRLEPMAALRRE